MLYELITFVVRPFRRWWRRMVIAAIVATVIVPAGRAYVRDMASDRNDTIVVPPPP